jgi:hypothetical protein
VVLDLRRQEGPGAELFLEELAGSFFRRQVAPHFAGEGALRLALRCRLGVEYGGEILPNPRAPSDVVPPRFRGASGW